MFCVINWYVNSCCCLTIFVHIHVETLPEPARLALVPARHVDDACAVVLAHVVNVPADGSLEEPSAAVAALYAVVLARRPVPAHQTQRALLRLCRRLPACVGAIRICSTVFGIGRGILAYFAVSGFFFGGCLAPAVVLHVTGSIVS